jgi:hypothetical protein
VSVAPVQTLPRPERRRLVAIGLLRDSATAVVVVAAYYLLPLDNVNGVSLGVALAVGLLALTAIVAYQVRAIIRHPHSAVRAIEALAINTSGTMTRASRSAPIPISCPAAPSGRAGRSTVCSVDPTPALTAHRRPRGPNRRVDLRVALIPAYRPARPPRRSQLREHDSHRP